MLYQVAPPVPTGLAKYPRAIERWNSLWLELEPTRVKPGMHGDWVMQYCVYYSDMRDAMEKMERGKLVAEQKRTTGTGDNQKVVVEKLGISPYQSVFDTAVRNMERIGRMIGMDPTKPLEEARTIADYLAFMNAPGNPDDEWEETDDGTDGPGDAGQCATGSDGDATADGPAAETQGRPGADQVLDERTDS